MLHPPEISINLLAGTNSWPSIVETLIFQPFHSITFLCLLLPTASEEFSTDSLSARCFSPQTWPGADNKSSLQVFFEAKEWSENSAIKRILERSFPPFSQSKRFCPWQNAGVLGIE
jgi:hypothetical protein